MGDRVPSGPSDYLAAERTFLAWIRTGLALMGFGFVVARFGLFLQAMQASQSRFHINPYGPPFWFGTALIVLGVVVNVVCARNHYLSIQALNRGQVTFNRPSWLAISVALILAAVGIAMAIYVVSVREPERTNPRSQENSMTVRPENGIVSVRSRHSVDETVQALEKTLQAKGVKLFALVDHSGEAQKAGMQMRPTKLAIFGSPKAGTPLMLAAPSIAIDLPLKILVAEDADGNVWVSYNSPSYLQNRHNLPSELLQNIAVVETLAAKIAE